jgi:DNA-binding CsgD family transcriptional regulator
MSAGRISEAIEIASRATAVPQATVRDQLIGAHTRAVVSELTGASDQAQAIFTTVLRLASEVGDARALLWAANSAAWAGDQEAGLRNASRAVEAARRQGVLSLLPGALEELASQFFMASNFEQAYAAAGEGYRLSLDVGHGECAHLANLAYVEAVWGREDDSRKHGEKALAIGVQRGSMYLAGHAVHALAFGDLSMGRPGRAADRLLALTDPQHPSYVQHPWLVAFPDTIEAAVRVDRREEAGRRLAEAERWVGLAPTPVRRALVARCRALVREGDADQAFGEAVDLAGALSPFERARTELLYGEWLRRERQRTTARAHLRTALELFQGLHAEPWARRAESELRATGETARKRDVSVVAELTPQEMQIAGLVAEGLTNKEIAAQLYLSPRTVDYHLRKVFTKLGIASRSELLRHGLVRPGRTGDLADANDAGAASS